MIYLKSTIWNGLLFSMTVSLGGTRITDYVCLNTWSSNQHLSSTPDPLR